MTTINNEEWRSISGYLNYQVSNVGRVRNSVSGKILKQSNTGNYKQVSLRGADNQYRSQYVHRLVAHEFLDPPEDIVHHCVDHIDRCKTNNYVSNLRWATQSQNLMNASKRSNATSKYKGVYWNKEKQKWKARIYLNGKEINLGYFSKEDEAGEAYNQKADEIFQTYSNPNVIE